MTASRHLWRSVCSRVFGACLGVLSAAEPAAAQLTPEATREEANRTRPYREPSMLSAQARFGELGEDWFFTAILQLNYNQEHWGIGLQLPLRLRLKDNDPQDDEVAGALRKQDWDEAADYLKLLRYVYIGAHDKRGPYFVQGGELLNLTVGHGTVMHRYFNNVDISRWRTGLNVATNIEGMTVDAMVGDLLGPYLTGGRVGIRPFQLHRGFQHRWFDRLEVGLTFFADWVAPFDLERMPSPDGPGPIIVDDATYEPLVAEKRVFTAFGLDLGLPLRAGDALTFTPYVDFNSLSVVQNGLGLHLGTLLELHVGRGLDHPFSALFRAEFRRVSGDYLGQYFNTVYEIERYQRLESRGSATRTPKLRALCGSEACDASPPSRSGVWLEASLGVRDIFQIGGEYLAYTSDRADGSFRLFVEVPYFDRVQAKAFYYRINTRGLGDAFGFDDRTALMAEVRVPFLYVLSGNFRWIRTWQARASEAGYAAVDDWNVGLGVFLRL